MGLAAGAAIVAALAGLDILWDDTVVIAAMVIGPFVAALRGSSRDTLLVGRAGLRHGGHQRGLERQHRQAATGSCGSGIIAAGTAFAVLSARAREQLDRDQERFEALEAQQDAVLGSLAEAVTVQDTTGRLIYANDAAAPRPRVRDGRRVARHAGREDHRAGS